MSSIIIYLFIINVSMMNEIDIKALFKNKQLCHDKNIDKLVKDTFNADEDFSCFVKRFIKEYGEEWIIFLKKINIIDIAGNKNICKTLFVKGKQTKNYDVKINYDTKNKKYYQISNNKTILQNLNKNLDANNSQYLSISH